MNVCTFKLIWEIPYTPTLWGRYCFKKLHCTDRPVKYRLSYWKHGSLVIASQLNDFNVLHNTSPVFLIHRTTSLFLNSFTHQPKCHSITVVTFPNLTCYMFHLATRRNAFYSNTVKVVRISGPSFENNFTAGSYFETVISNLIVSMLINTPEYVDT